MSGRYLFISHQVFIYLFIHSFIRGALCSVLFTKYLSGYQIKQKWAWHVASIGGRRGVYRVWWGDVMERDQLEDLSVDGRILKWICKKWDVVWAWTGLI
jgi:hypothetical protein